ncbi:arginase family protein [Phenylobacterium sp. J426]|nr:arginase family protein [Phenylobacterium sp. J426]
MVEALSADRVSELPRPPYKFGAEAGTRIRNGREIRAFSERLSFEVGRTLRDGGFPLVVGGDCSILLGCLLGSGAAGDIGLLHVDGHSDFFHPGNYDSRRRLGSVAGMDLALAVGRGELSLALWSGRPLVRDRDVVQIGEREALREGVGYGDIVRTEIRRLPMRTVLEQGVARTVAAALKPVDGERRRLWLHIDLDVLDRSVMPAVDSPGSPGLDFPQLAELTAGLLASGRIVGADVAIFDPELDPAGVHARAVVDCLRQGFAGLMSPV